VSETYSQFPLAAREDFESDLQFTLTFINKPKKNKTKKQQQQITVFQIVKKQNKINLLYAFLLRPIGYSSKLPLEKINTVIMEFS